MNRDKLKVVLIEFLKKQQFQDIRLEFQGTSGATDGYLGDINFATVKCESKNGEEKQFDLVIKSGKQLEGSIAVFDKYVNLYFQQEIVMYSKIFPEFRKFEVENNVAGYFEGIPECCTCLEKEKIVVLDNLKVQGYEVHDSKVALDWAHLKLILEHFGKFHAVSFAFEKKKRQEYKNLIKNLVGVDKKYSDMVIMNIFLSSFKNLLKILENKNETELYSEVNKILEKDLHKTILDLLKEGTSHKIVSHVDTWNNNLMFLYDQHKAVNAKLIDWQMAEARNSPVYDLSHFLYTCSSPEDLNRLDELLKIYYSSLASHLKQFGCDPNAVFPFDTLKEHWRKYSIVGFWFVPYVIKQCFWNAEDVRAGDDVEWTDVFDQIVIQDENYFRRLIGVVKHFFYYKLGQ